MEVNDQETLAVLAMNIRHYRNGRSFGDVAKAAGTYPTSIKRIEDGEHMPGAGLLTRLADALGVGVIDLLRPDTPKKKSRRQG